MITHLYAGAGWARRLFGGRNAIARTACGLRKAFVLGKVPFDVVDQAGRVTCAECLAKAPNGLSNGDFSAQQGKKAQ